MEVASETVLLLPNNIVISHSLLRSQLVILSIPLKTISYLLQAMLIISLKTLNRRIKTTRTTFIHRFNLHHRLLILPHRLLILISLHIYQNKTIITPSTLMTMISSQRVRWTCLKQLQGITKPTLYKIIRKTNHARQLEIS